MKAEVTAMKRGRRLDSLVTMKETRTASTHYSILLLLTQFHIIMGNTVSSAHVADETATRP